MEQYRNRLKDKKRIVVKIGSSSLQHPQTGELDYIKLEVLVRELCNLRNQGKDVVLVTSGAIAQGRRAMHLTEEDFSQNRIAMKQACAAIGQARLMMTYERIFAEYNQVTAQILLTKNTVVDNLNRYNAHNTFTQLLKMGVIPVVNENDTVATYELELDNDTLSAIVSALTGADLLILLSDIDGLYTDDPKVNPDAELITYVEEFSPEYISGYRKKQQKNKIIPKISSFLKDNLIFCFCLFYLLIFSTASNRPFRYVAPRALSYRPYPALPVSPQIIRPWSGRT